MNEPYAKVICHSKGPWKNHEYLQKINGVYIYAKDKISTAASQAKTLTSGKNAKNQSSSAPSSAPKANVKLYQPSMSQDKTYSTMADAKLNTSKIGKKYKNEKYTDNVKQHITGISDEERNEIAKSVAKAVKSYGEVDSSLGKYISSEELETARNNAINKTIGYYNQVRLNDLKENNGKRTIETQDIQFQVSAKAASYYREEMKKLTDKAKKSQELMKKYGKKN